ncbi:hypothetical protein SRHO_G00106440 [Serrasalmus rhombeus]
MASGAGDYQFLEKLSVKKAGWRCGFSTTLAGTAPQQQRHPNLRDDTELLPAACEDSSLRVKASLRPPLRFTFRLVTDITAQLGF